MQFYCVTEPEDGVFLCYFRRARWLLVAQSARRTHLCVCRQPMKAAIALQCTTGNCLYQDAAPTPTPSTHQGFWTGEMVTLLGMTSLLFVILLGACLAAQRILHE